MPPPFKSPPRAQAPLRLRAPPLVFAILGISILHGIVLLGAVWAASGLRGLNPDSAAALMWPCAIGAALAMGALWPRLRRRALIKRREISVRAGFAYAAAGFAWPLSFGLSALLQGDRAAALASLAPTGFGLLSGAMLGAIAGAAAGWAALTRG